MRKSRRRTRNCSPPTRSWRHRRRSSSPSTRSSTPSTPASRRRWTNWKARTTTSLNLLSSTNIATVFLDKELRVRRYTPAITRLLSLIPSDVGRPIADVLRRFSDEALLDDARRVLADLTPLSKEVQADDGRWYIRRITPYRTQDDRIEGVVITFVDVATSSRPRRPCGRARNTTATWRRAPTASSSGGNQMADHPRQPYGSCLSSHPGRRRSSGSFDDPGSGPGSRDRIRAA